MYNENIYVAKYADQDVVVGWFKRPENTDLLQEVFSEYKNQKVFVNWVSVFNGTETDGSYKKPKKVPFNPYTEKNASVDKPKTWIRLEGAINDGLRNTRKINGIGIVLNETDLTVIDVDQITDNSGKVVTDNVTDLHIIKELIKKFNSYTEVSPSGKGIHIFIKGKIKPNDDEETTKNGSFKYDGYTAKYEFFDGVTFSKGRFVTVTGDVVDGYDKISSVDTDVLRDFAVNGGNIKKIDQKYTAEYNNTCIETATKDDDEILAIVQDHRLFNPDNILFTDSNGSKLIVKVNDSGYEILPDDTNTDGFIDYKSPSEYDIALMGIISYLTKDPAQIGRIFRSSKYFKCFRFVRDRAKCKRVEYWKTTIKAAIKYAANHPEYNPFRFADVNYLRDNLHNKVLTDKVFGEYLFNKGLLNPVKSLIDVKEKTFIGYSEELGCWNLSDKNDGIVVDIIMNECDRLIEIIESKRAEEQADLDNKITEAESAGKKWVGPREIPGDPVYAYLVNKQSTAGIKAILSWIKTSSLVKAKQSDFDTAAETEQYLNFTDCKLNMNTGTFEEHSYKDKIAKSVDIRAKDYIKPDGSIKTDGTVEKFLKDFFTPTNGTNAGVFDKESYDYFISMIGAILYGSNKEKAIFFLHGPSHSGKSVLTDSLEYILGGSRNGGDQGYATRLSAGFFSKSDTGGNDEEMFKLKGARLAIGSEMRAEEVFNSPRLKMIAGNNRLAAMKKYESRVEFDNMVNLLIETNELPTTTNGGDNAYFNRIKIIKCLHVMRPETMDKDLRKKLIADKGGWLKLFKDASDKYRTEGLHDTESIKQNVKEYREDKFRIFRFANQCIDFTNDPDNFISREDLFEAFKEFLIDEYGETSADFAKNPDKVISEIRQAFGDKICGDRMYINRKQKRGIRGARFKIQSQYDDNAQIWE